MHKYFLRKAWVLECVNFNLPRFRPLSTEDSSVRIVQLAAGFLFLPAVSAISHFFKKRRSFALGILATGSSIGGVIYPILLNKLFPSIGFGWTVRAAAFLTLAMLFVANLTIRTRLPPRTGGPILDFSHFKDKGAPDFTFQSPTNDHKLISHSCID
jgi:MFS family permease